MFLTAWWDSVSAGVSGGAGGGTLGGPAQPPSHGASPPQSSAVAGSRSIRSSRTQAAKYRSPQVRGGPRDPPVSRGVGGVCSGILLNSWEGIPYIPPAPWGIPSTPFSWGGLPIIFFPVGGEGPPGPPFWGGGVIILPFPNLGVPQPPVSPLSRGLQLLPSPNRGAQGIPLSPLFPHCGVGWGHAAPPHAPFSHRALPSPQTAVGCQSAASP